MRQAIGVENLPPDMQASRRQQTTSMPIPGGRRPLGEVLPSGLSSNCLPGSRIPSPDGDISCQPEPESLHLDNVGLPSKMGSLCMIQNAGGRTVKTRVLLKVYSSSFGHYAVVSQDKLMSKECGYINLKTCTIKRVDSQPPSPAASRTDNGNNALQSKARATRNLHAFQVIPWNGEGQMLTFGTTDAEELEDWLSILDSANEEACQGEASLALSGSPTSRVPISPLSNSPRGHNGHRGARKSPALPSLSEEESAEE